MNANNQAGNNQAGNNQAGNNQVGNTNAMMASPPPPPPSRKRGSRSSERPSRSRSRSRSRGSNNINQSGSSSTRETNIAMVSPRASPRASPPPPPPSRKRGSRSSERPSRSRSRSRPRESNNTNQERLSEEDIINLLNASSPAGNKVNVAKIMENIKKTNTRPLVQAKPSNSPDRASRNARSRDKFKFKGRDFASNFWGRQFLGRPAGGYDVNKEKMIMSPSPSSSRSLKKKSPFFGNKRSRSRGDKRKPRSPPTYQKQEKFKPRYDIGNSPSPGTVARYTYANPKGRYTNADPVLSETKLTRLPMYKGFGGGTLVSPKDCKKACDDCNAGKLLPYSCNTCKKCPGSGTKRARDLGGRISSANQKRERNMLRVFPNTYNFAQPQAPPPSPNLISNIRLAKKARR